MPAFLLIMLMVSGCEDEIHLPRRLNREISREYKDKHCINSMVVLDERTTDGMFIHVPALVCKEE